MIAHLSGVVRRAGPNFVVLDVGGVGYMVDVAAGTRQMLPPPGGQMDLHIHTHVREDQIALYGFASAEELDLFEMLIQVDGRSVEITTPPNSFEKVKTAVEGLGVSVENAEITMQPKQTVAVGEDKAAAVLRLMESLEEDDDVQQVYANFDIPSDVLERVSAQV